MILFALVAAAAAGEPRIPVVDLGSRTESSDGFRVQIEPAVFAPGEEEKPGGVSLISFVAEVPEKVGETQLGIAWFQIEGAHGETIALASLERKNRENVVRCRVDLEKALVERSVLHFQYIPIGEPGHFVRDYVVRLKHHMPK